MIKTFTANQNRPNYKEVEHLKRQITKLQHTLIINRNLLCIGVNTNIVIVVVMVIGVNGPLYFPFCVSCFL